MFPCSLTKLWMTILYCPCDFPSTLETTLSLPCSLLPSNSWNIKAVCSPDVSIPFPVSQSSCLLGPQNDPYQGILLHFLTFPYTVPITLLGRLKSAPARCHKIRGALLLKIKKVIYRDFLAEEFYFLYEHVIVSWAKILTSAYCWS